MAKSNQRLIFLALNVEDLDRSRSFYHDAFGIDFHADRNEPESDLWYGGDHAAFSWFEGAYIHFALFPARPPYRAVSRDVQIGFSVADAAAAHHRAVDGGVTVVHGPRDEPWGITARYRDPDGNLVSITEPRR